MIFSNNTLVEQNSFFDNVTKINLNDPNLQRLSHRINALKNRALSVDLKSQIAILDAPYSFVYFFVIYLISPIASLIFLVMVLLALAVNFRRKPSMRLRSKVYLGLAENARDWQKTILEKADTIQLFSNLKRQNKNWREAEKDSLQ